MADWHFSLNVFVVGECRVAGTWVIPVPAYRSSAVAGRSGFDPGGLLLPNTVSTTTVGSSAEIAEDGYRERRISLPESSERQVWQNGLDTIFEMGYTCRLCRNHGLIGTELPVLTLLS